MELLKNKKIIICIIICVVVFIALFCLSRYMGGYLIGVYNPTLTENLNNSHIIVNLENLETNLKSTIIYSFENDYCVSERIQYTFENNQKAQEQYDIWINMSDNSFININLKENVIVFNTDTNIGKNKNEILESCKELEKTSNYCTYMEI